MDSIKLNWSQIYTQIYHPTNMNPLTAMMLMKSVKSMKKRIKKLFVCSKKSKWRLHNSLLMTFPRLKSLLRRMSLSKVIKKMTVIMVLNKQILPFSKMETNHLSPSNYLRFKRKTLLLKIKTISHRLIKKSQQNRGKSLFILDLTATKRKNKKNWRKMELINQTFKKEGKVKEQLMDKRNIRLMSSLWRLRKKLPIKEWKSNKTKNRIY